VGVILENGVSTKNSKAGDSIYLRTSFPLTMNNRIVIPVGSYIRGEIIDSKRPGRVKGRGEMRLRLNTLILPNGYTVNLTAAPRSADSAAKGTMDDEGKVTSPGGKGTDLATVARTTAETTATGAGIGAASGSIRGVGIGAGVGALVGLGAILLTRGPDAELPRGSSLDIVLERDVALDGSQIKFKDLGQAMPAVVPVLQQQRALP
jgi:type IV secretion system protein VirB10